MIGLLAGVTVLLSCGRGPSPAPPLPEDPKMMTIQLQSSAFKDGGPIPKLYTCDGKDVSPPLSWTGVPEAAKSLALICDDPDAPRGTWTHWMTFNIPPDTRELPEGVPPEPRWGAATQGKNDFGKPGYGGPCPPRGTHHYIFRLYALDTTLDPASADTKDRLIQAMRDHILAEGRLVGTYAR
jgi:Raf kinase inhibitor-like YbhB/YbcL family protein